MSHETLKNTEIIQFVAAEEQSVETKAGQWLSRVHFWVRGPNSGLWFWSVAQACGKAIASGYANSRNEAIQACMEFIRGCDGEQLSPTT
jgi:hypothetical protein